MQTGAYLAMARPYPRIRVSVGGRESPEKDPPPPKASDRGRRTWVRTYYPAAIDRSQAGRIVVRGATQLDGCDIHLFAAPVHAIRGVVLDDAGKPANGAVSLAPLDVMEMAEKTVMAQDGFFEFPDAPAGDWRIVAEATRGGVKLRGVTPVMVSGKDLDSVTN